MKSQTVTLSQLKPISLRPWKANKRNDVIDKGQKKLFLRSFIVIVIKRVTTSGIIPS